MTSHTEGEAEKTKIKLELETGNEEIIEKLPLLMC